MDRFVRHPTPAIKVQRVNEFAIHHCEAALQVARGRVQAQRVRQTAIEKERADRERALTYIKRTEPNG